MKKVALFSDKGKIHKQKTPVATSNNLKRQMVETVEVSDTEKQVQQSPTSSQKQVQSSIDSVFERDHIIDAEIRWCLKVVQSRYSQRSCGNVVKLFTAMFHKSKCGYVINHGIAPYWEHLLLQEVTNSPFYVLSFEESLNKHLQKGQIDIIVRYWNGDKFTVETRYLTSEFLGAAKAVDIFEKLKWCWKKN